MVDRGTPSQLGSSGARQMNDELLTLCLADICRGNKAESFANDPAGTVKEYGLSPDAEKAILEGDVVAMQALGAHPVLTMYLARSMGVSPSEYMRALRPQDQDVHSSGASAD